MMHPVAHGIESVMSLLFIILAKGALIMTSILTNNAAIAALATLRGINSNLEDTQNHVSSGLRIGEAADNAAYWSIASTMKSDKGSLDTVSDALGLATAKVDTAYNGLNQVKDLLAEIRNKLTLAQESGVDRSKVFDEITQLKQQITTVATSSSFSGENWLNNTGTNAIGTKDMVGSFTRDGSGNVSLQMISFDASASCLIDKNTASRGILTMANTVGTNKYHLILATGGTAPNGSNEITLANATSTAIIGEMMQAVSTMFNSVVNVSGTLGASKARIDSQANFVKTLSETIDKGVSKLVDADMNEESTRLKALQTQQQLGIQSLSIANSTAQNLMQLFRS